MVRVIMFFFFQENKEVCATKLVDNKCENSKKLTNFYNSNLFMNLKFILLTRVHSRFILKQSRIPLCASLAIPYTFNYSTNRRGFQPLCTSLTEKLSLGTTPRASIRFTYIPCTRREKIFSIPSAAASESFSQSGGIFSRRERALSSISESAKTRPPEKRRRAPHRKRFSGKRQKAQEKKKITHGAQRKLASRRAIHKQTYIHNHAHAHSLTREGERESEIVTAQ